MKKRAKLNNIQFDNVVITNKGENLIFSPCIKEEFFGIYTVELFGESILCDQYKDNYVNCSVKLNNDLFENVIFRLVKSSVERIVVNEQILNDPYTIVESVDALDEKDLIIESLRTEIHSLKQKNNTLKKKVTLATESSKPASMQPYKEELLREFIDFTQQQRQVLSENLETIENKLINIVENKFIVRQKDLTLETLAEADKYYSEITNNIIPHSIEATERVFKERYDKLEVTLHEQLDYKISQIESKIEDNFKIIQENLKDLALTEGEELLTEKVKGGHKYTTALEKASGKKKLITETDKELTRLNKKLDEYGSKINALINEKKNIQTIVESNKQYVDIKFNQLLEESRRYSRTVSEIYAGGGSGSVARQFAAGGEVRGDLSVTGSILSGGKDLSTIFLEESGSNTIYGDFNLASGSYLSGGQTMVDIFAGEGGADDNVLDGGTY